MTLEEKVLKSFIKYEGKEVEGLELIVAIPDCWGDDDEYYCQVLESKDNGKVWEVTCTRTGNVKGTYLI